GPATVEVIEYADLAEAEAAVAEGTVDAALVEGREVVYQELPSPELETLLGDAHQHAFTVYSLGELGIDPAEALEFLSVPPLEQRWLDEAADRAHARLRVAVVGDLLLYVHGGQHQPLVRPVGGLIQPPLFHRESGPRRVMS